MSYEGYSSCHHPFPIITTPTYFLPHYHNHPFKYHKNTEIPSIINTTIVNINISNTGVISTRVISTGGINTGEIDGFYDSAVFYHCAADTVNTMEGMVSIVKRGGDTMRSSYELQTTPPALSSRSSG